MTYIGTSGWTYKGWEKKAIPSKKTFYANKSDLEEYAKHFNMVEINSTFYKQPSIKTVEKWKQTKIHFLVKVNKYLTHNKKLLEWNELFPSFYDVMSRLQDQLLGFVVQLPPMFHNTAKNRERILNVAKWCKKQYPTVDFYVEFRHSSWFCDEISQLLKGYWNIILVHSEYFGFNNQPNPMPDKIMFRLHGTWKSQLYCGCYSDEYLCLVASLLSHGGIVAFNNTDSYQYQIPVEVGLSIFIGCGDTILPSAVADAKRLQILI